MLTTVTLRPDADMGNIGVYAYPALPLYSKVNEEVADDDATYIYSYVTNMPYYALFGIPDLSLTGAIQSVYIRMRCKVTTDGSFPLTYGYAKTILRTHEVNFYGNYSAPYPTWGDALTIYSVNPYTAYPWTWDEINNMLIGVQFGKVNWGVDQYAYCTQLYVTIYYETTRANLRKGMVKF